jgi:hypothetical protein
VSSVSDAGGGGRIFGRALALTRGSVGSSSFGGMGSFCVTSWGRARELVEACEGDEGRRAWGSFLGLETSTGSSSELSLHVDEGGEGARAFFLGLGTATGSSSEESAHDKAPALEFLDGRGSGSDTCITVL